MSDFLTRMTETSTQRWAEAREREDFEDLWDRAIDVALPPALQLESFDLIAECKLASPSEGVLSNPDAADATEHLVNQALAYEAAGAAAISVLTEPTSFGGSLEHLAAVAEAVNVPVMRKDFLVADYQVVEARGAGAGGVLLIARMLSDEDLFEMLDLTLDLGMFALVEAFDAEDLARVRRMLITRGRELATGTTLLGLNCRNLADLSIDAARFAALKGEFPSRYKLVAESGLATAADVGRIAALGYDLALVGSALMKSRDPALLAGSMLDAGREARHASADAPKRKGTA